MKSPPLVEKRHVAWVKGKPFLLPATQTTTPTIEIVERFVHSVCDHEFDFDPDCDEIVIGNMMVQVLSKGIPSAPDAL